MNRLLVLAFAVLPCWGCTTTQVVAPGEMAAIAPSLSVERFLHASNARDLHAMARIFGTDHGPIIETGSTFGCAFKKMGSWIGLGDRCMTLQEVEVRMDAIAQILNYQDYVIRSESSVPGRSNPTTRVEVDMTINGRDIQAVPFLVVRTHEGRWLIEEIGLTRITG